MKTPTMPDDRAISVSPASTQGIPLAPSAARVERLRRPIAIIAPQPTSPKIPAIMAPHFHQPSRVPTVFDSPGGATGAGFGAPATLAAWWSAVRPPAVSAWMSSDILSLLWLQRGRLAADYVGGDGSPGAAHH